MALGTCLVWSLDGYRRYDTMAGIFRFLEWRVERAIRCYFVVTYLFHSLLAVNSDNLSISLYQATPAFHMQRPPVSRHSVANARLFYLPNFYQPKTLFENVEKAIYPLLGKELSFSNPSSRKLWTSSDQLFVLTGTFNLDVYSLNMIYPAAKHRLGVYLDNISRT